MYDTLEGLDYKDGECSLYVSQVLSNIQQSMNSGDLVKMPASDVKVGDVVVSGWSSHLITNDDYITRTTINAGHPDHENQTNTPNENDIHNPLILVIPERVLRRKQKEYIMRNEE
jgi:hypothetical protein